MLEFIYNNEAAIRLFVFVLGLTLLALWEWISPKRELTQAKAKRWLNNIALVVSSTVLLRVFVPIAAVGVAYHVEHEHEGLLNHLQMPFWIRAVVSFIILDISIYFQHVFFHVIPVLWRFHRVHHSDLDCDVTTGVRFHPVEIILSILLKFLAIISIGAPVLSVILFELVLNLMSMFSHSNIRLNEKFERILRRLFVTPDMHRVHHSMRENETNSNFGFNLSLWDRAFGTYMAQPEAGHQEMIIGLDQFREPKWQTISGLLRMPFETGIRGYAINYRDTSNADELALARELAHQNEEKAKLSSELSSYIQAVDMQALVSTTDLSGRIIHVNDRFCETSGYDRDELLGQNHRIVNSGTHPRIFFEELWTTIAKGDIWSGEICNRNKAGGLYWVDSSIVPIKSTDGRIERYMSVRFDVTDRKQAEKQLNILNESLESKVEQRTRELYQAKEEAEEANKAKSRFLSNMSHEFRTPLHSILSFSSIGLKKFDTLPVENLRQFLTDIRGSGENLLKLVNDLLDLSKLEMKSTIYDYQSVDIKEIINRVICELSVLAEQRYIDFKLIAPKEAVVALMDSVKIAQVVRNLLSNALKFSPEHGQVEISVSRNASGYPEVLVADQGIGIPEGETALIFDAFVQSSLTRTNAGGTGLGLPICREIIQSGHNGRIYAENGMNGGSRFIFTLGDVKQVNTAA